MRCQLHNSGLASEETRFIRVAAPSRLEVISPEGMVPNEWIATADRIYIHVERYGEGIARMSSHSSSMDRNSFPLTFSKTHAA